MIWKDWDCKKTALEEVKKVSIMSRAEAVKYSVSMGMKPSR